LLRAHRPSVGNASFCLYHSDWVFTCVTPSIGEANQHVDETKAVGETRERAVANGKFVSYPWLCVGGLFFQSALDMANCSRLEQIVARFKAEGFSHSRVCLRQSRKGLCKPSTACEMVGGIGRRLEVPIAATGLQA
jgi:hypothetical protein